MSVGTQIQKLRNEKEMSALDLAKQLNKSESTIRMWESDNSKPDIDNLVKLAEIFGCTTDYLLGLSEYKSVRGHLDAYSYLSQQLEISSPAIQKKLLDIFESILVSYNSFDGYKGLNIFFLDQLFDMLAAVEKVCDDACIVDEGIYHGAIECEDFPYIENEVIDNCLKNEKKATKILSSIFYKVRSSIKNKIHEVYEYDKPTLEDIDGILKSLKEEGE